MTSIKQIEANRRNAGESTGPTTEEGKKRSRRNAIRHGLTAETVIGALEDAQDYASFEAAIIADYDAQSAVERELVLRLASLLWRLRRATTIETGLFEIQADHLSEIRQIRHLRPNWPDITDAMRSQSYPFIGDRKSVSDGITRPTESPAPNSVNPVAEVARCYLRLVNLPAFVLDRLSRYEIALWRQVDQTLVALDALDRRKPQERRGQTALPGSPAVVSRIFRPA